MSGSLSALDEAEELVDHVSGNAGGGRAAVGNPASRRARPGAPLGAVVAGVRRAVTNDHTDRPAGRMAR
jgi:hypothetical protein